LPSTGPLRHLRLPPGIRVDSGVDEGGEVTGFYDPMIAKLIVHAPNRRAAARKLAAACATVEVWPVRTNAAFLSRVAGDAAFAAGEIDTGFIERRAAALIPSASPSEEVVAEAASALVAERRTGDVWSSLTGFRSNAGAQLKVAVTVGEHSGVAEANLGHTGATVAVIDGERVLFHRGEAWAFGAPNSTQGQTVLALEAMKMEHALIAPFAGTVADLSVSVGNQVAENVTLVRIVADP
jgi:3-methylcrotonyl-CoA carboxylase alpha subunit